MVGPDGTIYLNRSIFTELFHNKRSCWSISIHIS